MKSKLMTMAGVVALVAMAFTGCCTCNGKSACACTDGKSCVCGNACNCAKGKACACDKGKPCTCCTDHAKCACGKTGCNCKK